MTSESSWAPILLWISLAIIAGSLMLRSVRLYQPLVIRYPWALEETEVDRTSDKKKKVLFAGSFNPPHHGHLAMLRYLAQRYNEVIAVVGINRSKKYMVSPVERAEFIEKIVADGNIKGNVRVEVVSGYIWRFAMRENVAIMFRGIRSWRKDGKEERVLHLLNTCGPIILGPLKWPLPTYFLEGKPEYNHISSTLIRNICLEAREKGEEPDLSALVPDAVASSIAGAYSRNK